MSSQSPQRSDSARPTVTARRLMGRRIGALVLMGVVLYSFALAMAGVFGGTDDVAGADDVGFGVGAVETTPDGASSDADGVVAAVGGSTPSDAVAPIPVDTAAVITEPIATEPRTTGPPSPENKARVYIVGDSDAGTFGPYLVSLLDGTKVVNTELNYKVSSGLARPDFYDWPTEIAAALPAADPDIVVATFGGNDSQGLSLPGDTLTFVVGDPVSNEAAWTEEYTKRAGDMMDLLLENGRTLIWVGIPNDDNPDVTARLAIQDKAVKAAAAARPGVVFIDTWTRFSGRDGGWAEFVIDPRDNVGKDVRAEDGFHLNVNGAEILALDIAEAVRDDLRVRGANI